MRIIDTKDNELEINNRHWPLAEDLFFSWGYVPTHDNIVKVKDVDDIYLELSAWGIPWKRTTKI